MTTEWVEQARVEYRALRGQAERALAQIDDGTFLQVPNPEGNSLALIVKHVGGNLRSRWTEPLTTDGEKPTRDRDGEFEIRPGDTRESLMAAWQQGFATVDAALAALREEDLARPVIIRGQALSLPAAVLRSLTHTAGHVGQIVFLSKHFSGERWQTLSLRRGQSAHWRPATPPDASPGPPPPST
jgi:hypothetical protein